MSEDKRWPLAAVGAAAGASPYARVYSEQAARREREAAEQALLPGLMACGHGAEELVQTPFGAVCGGCLAQGFDDRLAGRASLEALGAAVEEMGREQP